jgi:hypothetical protein
MVAQKSWVSTQKPHRDGSIPKSKSSSSNGSGKEGTSPRTHPFISSEQTEHYIYY